MSTAIEMSSSLEYSECFILNQQYHNFSPTWWSFLCFPCIWHVASPCFPYFHLYKEGMCAMTSALARRFLLLPLRRGQGPVLCLGEHHKGLGLELNARSGCFLFHQRFLEQALCFRGCVLVMKEREGNVFYSASPVSSSCTQHTRLLGSAHGGDCKQARVRRKVTNMEVSWT